MPVATHNILLPSQDIEDVFGKEGILSQYLPGYKPRPIQQTMASAVKTAIEHYQTLVIEAGTGTGKTFAYLIPAILANKKIIISTGTKNLQDQLFHRDLPIIRKALRRPIKAALLKGRNNYLCLHRLDQAYHDGRFTSQRIMQDLHHINSWSKSTQSGDTGECTSLNEESASWHYATSTVDNCLGQDCPALEDCFLLKARRIALEADIIVVNHHLFFADTILRDIGFGEILPSSHVVIFDEAHQLPEVASQFFGDIVSGRQLIELARDVIAEQIKAANDMPVLREYAQNVEQAVQQLRYALGQQDQKNSWSNIRYKPALQTAITHLKDYLVSLQKVLTEIAERSKNLESCLTRAQALLIKFNLLTDKNPSEVAGEYANEEHIHWYETQGNNFRIHLTPLQVSKQFKNLMAEQKRAWIFTSATLAIGNDFSHYLQPLGLEHATTLQLASNFDYAQQGMIYLPQNLPSPDDENYSIAVTNAVIPVLLESQGRAFFLFTSHRALRQAAVILAEKINYPLFVQGDMPKRALLNKFCQTPNAILLGTSSFWEGVDVKGDALSCVIIDKLPFSSPDDPVLKARLAHLKRQGKDAFFNYQLPNAVISLKQGAGRLIRDQNDRGILVIADPRVLTKPYGKVFLDNLPPMRLTQDIKDVQTFFS
jgi:ATP-dependent DNA helicase DinG